MNVIVSLSHTPMAQPPRSNPFLRSSSDAPPFPCITPSTVTCVIVLSFMVAAPFSLGFGSVSLGRVAVERHRIDGQLQGPVGLPLVQDDVLARAARRVVGAD